MESCTSVFICVLLLNLILFSDSGHTQDIELDCIPSIKVSRNTVWKSPELKTLMINCTVIVTPHCWRNLSFSWCKISDGNNCRPLNHSNHTSTKWRNINEEERILFLVFWSLSVEDAGLYRCEILEPVYTTGHGINVTVTASDEVFGLESKENKTITVSMDFKTVNNENKTADLRESEQSETLMLFSGVSAVVIVVALALLFQVMFKTIFRKDSEKCVVHKDLFTKVHYGPADTTGDQLCRFIDREFLL